ncbi:hypothetical protein PIB30_040622 [Stylosanthes scabra]|uniref:Uncharacterized protein n=1 Tax=Stylosanthes scabra TaxID=79078 RepID=A0ABU6TFE6_9FABA|nr:hypothetical protein [Stylosanthes scabra]
MRTEPTVSQGQPQMTKIHGIRDKEPIINMEPKISQDKDATPTPSQEGSLLTPATLEALEKLHEETEKKMLVRQTEAKMEDILRMQAAIRAFDNLETSVQEIEEPKTPRKMLYKWATEGEGDMMYEFLFKFINGKTYATVREHFMSLARQGEMDLAYHMVQKYQHNYFDKETGHSDALSTWKDNDGFEYIDKFKMKRAQYLNILD